MGTALTLAQSPKSVDCFLDPEARLAISSDLDANLLSVTYGSKELGGTQIP